MPADVNVTSFEPSFDDQGRPEQQGLTVEWLQNENAVVYRTRLFKLAASVEVNIDSTEQYEIGFIQVCTDNFQGNFYTGGATQAWELDGLPVDKHGYSHIPVNDSDSDDNVPWYNINPARTVVVGPVTHRVVHIEMTDGFSPRVSCTEAGAPTSYLRQILRDQKFSVWLVAHKSGSSDYKPLQWVGWIIPVDIRFTSPDPSSPDGVRPNYSSWQNFSQGGTIARAAEPPPIPARAFRGTHWRSPRANSFMALYRYPAGSSVKQFVSWAD